MTCLCGNSKIEVSVPEPMCRACAIVYFRTLVSWAAASHDRSTSRQLSPGESGEPAITDPAILHNLQLMHELKEERPSAHVFRKCIRCGGPVTKSALATLCRECFRASRLAGATASVDLRKALKCGSV